MSIADVSPAVAIRRRSECPRFLRFGSARRWYRGVVVVGVAVGVLRGVAARAAASHLPAAQCAMGGVLNNLWTGHLTTVPDRWPARQSQGSGVTLKCGWSRLGDFGLS
jgi:hypothetical protein